MMTPMDPPLYGFHLRPSSTTSSCVDVRNEDRLPTKDIAVGLLLFWRQESLQGYVCQLEEILEPRQLLHEQKAFALVI